MMFTWENGDPDQGCSPRYGEISGRAAITIPGNISVNFTLYKHKNLPGYEDMDDLERPHISSVL